MSVLPFFGAAGTTDEGYMVVPDGRGLLLHSTTAKRNWNHI